MRVVHRSEYHSALTCPASLPNTTTTVEVEAKYRSEYQQLSRFFEACSAFRHVIGYSMVRFVVGPVLHATTGNEL